jgi:hypothetical protein
MEKDDSDSSKLPKKYTKSNLPVKICEQCNRPMEWRKSWAKNWDEVKYCSDKCRKLKKKNPLLNAKSSGNSLVSDSIPNIIGRGGNINKPISRSFILTGAAMLSSSLSNSKKAKAEAAVTGFENKGNTFEDIFLDKDWASESTGFRKGDFSRLDEQSDQVFYNSTRFVEHIDTIAVEALKNFHSTQFQLLSEKLYKEKFYPLKVLDLCSSWVSHLPTWYEDIPKTRRITTGLGMNEIELSNNTQLTDWVVKDLNAKTDNDNSPTLKLPFESNVYDIVLLQLSIDYLIHPIEVLKEAARVLRDGGIILIRLYYYYKPYKLSITSYNE